MTFDGTGDTTPRGVGTEAGAADARAGDPKAGDPKAGNAKAGNAKPGDVKPGDVGGIAGEKLKSFIERIERLEEERKAIAGDIKEIFAEAKGHGFDTGIMRQVIRLRRMDRAEAEEQETLLDLYLQALGMAELA